jgi:hypothetical protein
VTVDVLRPWIWGVSGFVRWLTTSPGADPWFRFGGGTEAMVYPGDRFGIAGPIPSMRLKMERNAVQDVSLLAALAKSRAADTLRAEAARRFNSTAVGEWHAPRPKLADTNPEDWNNADIDDWIPKNRKFTTGLDSGAWQRVREYVQALAKEEK